MGAGKRSILRNTQEKESEDFANARQHEASICSSKSSPYLFSILDTNLLVFLILHWLFPLQSPLSVPRSFPDL